MNTSKDNQSENRRSFEREILEDNIEVRKEFLRHYKHEISNFIDSITVAHERWESFDKNISNDEQKAYISFFIFNAVSNLSVSMKLFIGGYTVPSGSLFRITIESVAMGLLCSNNKLSIYEKIIDKNLTQIKQ